MPGSTKYSFCESVTGIGPWHIRKLTSKGQKLGGGIDTPSLCDLVQPMGVTGPDGRRGGGGWDLKVEIDERLLGQVCAQCAARYREIGGIRTKK